MSMATKITLQMDPTDRILLKRGLNKNGRAQLFFTNEVKRQCDPYTPKRNNIMISTAVVHPTCIEYVQPYSRRQYYENQGKGAEGTSNHGLRGKMWDKRMWADKGPQIVKAVANFCGGKVG